MRYNYVEMYEGMGKRAGGSGIALVVGDLPRRTQAKPFSPALHCATAGASASYYPGSAATIIMPLSWAETFRTQGIQ